MMRSFSLVFMILLTAPGFGQEHHHGGSPSTPIRKITAPKIFLDKSPRIVAYQLKRLDNQRLLMVQRDTSDEKYIPVYDAILSRVGMSPQYREEAVGALVELQESDTATVLLAAISQFDMDNRDERRAARQLAGMLLRQPRESLRKQSGALRSALESEDAMSRRVAIAGLVSSDQADVAIETLDQGTEAKLAFLRAIDLIPKPAARAPLRPHVVELLEESDSVEVQRAAVLALGFLPNDQGATFDRLATRFANNDLRDAVVRTLLKIPVDRRDVDLSTTLAAQLVRYAEQTPPQQRTTDAFIDAMQLADQLLAVVPSSQAKDFRRRLDEVTVRVVRIKTVEEEMRYDTAYFAVQAGKSVQIVLENEDLMPHNLVVTTPGSLKEVAQLGLQVGPNNGWKGLQYVPESDKVLFATQMVPSRQTARLTFTAPSEPGEYPYVCTFPQHWYRMYGVMVVVEDLDAWSKNPVEPANPIGSNRTFVQAWTVDDLRDDLSAGLRGRSAEIGQRIFTEASCAGCHKIKGEGGVIGPELTDVVTRWKGDRVGILREILDPSHKVDAKYAMQRILTVDGRTITGVLVAEDDDNVTMMSNPEATEPTVIPQDEIDAMVPSSVSMMPKALLDQYTKDEIFELMAYLISVDPNQQ